MEGKFINRYESFCRSLASLEEAKHRDLRNNLTHDYDGTLSQACAEKIVTTYVNRFCQFRDRAAE